MTNRRAKVTLNMEFDYDLDDMEQFGARTDDDALSEDALEAFHECTPTVTIERYEAPDENGPTWSGLFGIDPDYPTLEDERLIRKHDPEEQR